jgi:hypothetical protein
MMQRPHLSLRAIVRTSVKTLFHGPENEAATPRRFLLPIA